MWEYSLQLFNEEMCDRFYNSLISQLKPYKGLITKLKNTLLFAYSSNKVKSLIKTEIIKFIILEYKVDYFSIKLKNVELSDIKKKALIKVLSIFDNDFDTLFISGVLKIEKELVLESFIRFLLKDLIYKWDEIVTLILNNSFYLFCSGTYNELLKFLVNTIETKWAEVNLIIKDDEILVFDKEFKRCLIKDSDNVLVLTELIGFSPNVINIYCNNVIDCPAFNSIIDIFQDKVIIKPLTMCKNS